MENYFNEVFVVATMRQILQIQFDKEAKLAAWGSGMTLHTGAASAVWLVTSALENPAAECLQAPVTC